MDEHRIGLKPILRRIWAPKGATVKAPVAQRYEWMYVLAGCRIRHPRADELAALAHGQRGGLLPRASPLLPRKWEQGQTNTSCWSLIVLAGTAVLGSSSQRGSTWCSCRPIPQKCSRLPDCGHFLAEPLANRVFTSFDVLEEVQAER